MSIDNNALTTLAKVKSYLGLIDYGRTSMQGAVADDGGVQTTETIGANNSTAGDMALTPATPAVNDAYYFGALKKFNQLILNIGTAGVGTWTIAWEYYNGSWTSLSGVTDGTNHFMSSGENEVNFTEPTDWVQTTVNSISAFWIRGQVSAYTSKTTQPLGTQAWITSNDDALLENLVNRSYKIIEAYCNRPFRYVNSSGVAQAVTEYFNGWGQTRLFLRYYPVILITSLYDDPDRLYGSSDLIDSDDYVTHDDYGILELDGLSFANGKKSIKITYTGGYETVPYDLEHVCNKLVAMLYKEKDSVGLASKSFSDGSVGYFTDRLSPQDKVVLDGYRSQRY